MYTDDMAFMDAIVKVLAHEGGYVNDPKDPGGETNFGISKRSYPAVNIKTLTQAGAMVIYYNDYWLKNRYNEITDSRLAAKTFDLAVNMGAGRVNKFLQRLVNVVEDGAMGPHTLNAINSTDVNALYDGLMARAEEHYEHIIENNPALEKYRKGWMNRLRS